MRVFVLKEEMAVYEGFKMIATFEPFMDGILVSPTPACSIGRYFAALNTLHDKGYKKVYEKPFK